MALALVLVVMVVFLLYSSGGAGRIFQKITCSSRGVGSVMWSRLPRRMTV